MPRFAAPAFVRSRWQKPQVVTSTADTGFGSLRQAVLAAHAGDTITFHIPPPPPGYNASAGVFTIGLTSGQIQIANDDWQTTQIGPVITSDQRDAIQNSSLAPTNPAEFALIATLPAGLYSAIAQGADGGSGVGLIEVYTIP